MINIKILYLSKNVKYILDFFYNCINKGNIEGNAKKIGGLIGSTYVPNYGSLVLENCKNEGQITTTEAINDLVGECSKYDNIIIK